ncbi:uncharacterized protein LOC123307734 [Coccinella septempunctata]|uniref:uncharacterized protein LOC123307734 n=1 Tax=Coccinella septempunctata TaxID=41139 RepID=UPI001D0929F1|nr:uncharacterized protein LOC123307734 [Coccinella septempunctata]
MPGEPGREDRNSVIDDVLSSQRELGPKVPDGGYGWVVFVVTLFFQIFIPSLIVVYGILIASVKINEDINQKDVLHLWDEKLTYVPLFHTMGWIFFDPAARNLISRSRWPRLVGQAGNSLTCAGLLFVWMGMTGNVTYVNQKLILLLGGLLSGIGSSIQSAQCEILLAQYFKTKHLYLTHITHVFVALGFILTPIFVSQLRMRYDLLQVVLIYQAILLQGLLLNVAFKKPQYLKSKLVRYHYVTENPDDEEDIFSKSLTELKIKTENVLKRFELKNDGKAVATTSGDQPKRNDWVEFDDDEGSTSKNWEKFEDDNESRNHEENYSKLEDYESPPTGFVNGPVPLFTDVTVNMNNTYAFDDGSIESDPKNIPTVFADTQGTTQGFNPRKYLRILRTPTFYKSLLTIVTTKYSVFLFYALFPSYFYVRIPDLRFKKTAFIIGCLSVGSLVFSGFSYWLNVTKQRRPVILFLLCWIGANGYFLIAMYSNNEYLVIFGAAEIVLSIASLQHIGGPLLGLTIRGESNSEYFLLSILSGLSFFVFLLTDLSYKDCFLLMALLHIITGLLWVFNHFYKKIKIYNIM